MLLPSSNKFCFESTPFLRMYEHSKAKGHDYFLTLTITNEFLYSPCHMSFYSCYRVSEWFSERVTLYKAPSSYFVKCRLIFYVMLLSLFLLFSTHVNIHLEYSIFLSILCLASVLFYTHITHLSNLFCWIESHSILYTSFFPIVLM